MILIGQLELNAGPELPGLMCNTVGFYLKGPQMGQLLQIVQVAWGSSCSLRDYIFTIHMGRVKRKSAEHAQNLHSDHPALAQIIIWAFANDSYIL